MPGHSARGLFAHHSMASLSIHLRSTPQLHLCGTHRLSPSLAPTATHTASSSSLKPQLVMVIAPKASLHYEAPLKPGTSPSVLHLPPKFRLARNRPAVPVCPRQTAYLAMGQLARQMNWTTSKDSPRKKHRSHLDTELGYDPGVSGCSPQKPNRRKLRARSPF